MNLPMVSMNFLVKLTNVFYKGNKMSNRICIKRHNHIIDVFHGEEGFEPGGWTRFLLVRGYLKFVKGSNMSPSDFALVKKEMGI